MTKLRRAFPLVAIPALVALPAVVRPAESPSDAAAPSAEKPEKAEKAIDPAAEKLLRAMTDYLSGLRTFAVRSASVDEVVLKSGEKLQLLGDSRVSVARPNRLRSEQVGPGGGMAFWYDGHAMTLYCKATNTYGTVPAPPTLDATIDEARKKYEVEAPGADLLYSHPYEILTEQVTGGQFVGRETIDGVAANHLAFTGEEVDWQIWIQDGPTPLPLRYTITTKTMKEEPEFTAALSHWEPHAAIADATFAFKPPAGAKRVDSLPTSCQPASQPNP